MKNVAVIISDSDRRGDTIRSRSRYIIYFERARDDAKTGNNDIDVVTILKSLLVEDIIKNKHVTSRFDLITIVLLNPLVLVLVLRSPPGISGVLDRLLKNISSSWSRYHQLGSTPRPTSQTASSSLTQEKETQSRSISRSNESIKVVFEAQMSKVFSSSLFYLFVNWTSFIHLIFCSTQRTFYLKKTIKYRLFCSHLWRTSDSIRTQCECEERFRFSGQTWSCDSVRLEFLV